MWRDNHQPLQAGQIKDSSFLFVLTSTGTPFTVDVLIALVANGTADLLDCETPSEYTLEKSPLTNAIPPNIERY